MRELSAAEFFFSSESLNFFQGRHTRVSIKRFYERERCGFYMWELGNWNRGDACIGHCLVDMRIGNDFFIC